MTIMAPSAAKIAPIAERLPPAAAADVLEQALMPTPRAVRMKRDFWPMMNVTLSAAVVLVWLLALTLVEVLTKGASALRDGALAGPSVVLAFIAFEGRIALKRSPVPSPRCELFISIFIAHLATAWYGVLRLYVAATASTSIGLEVAHVALIYAALLVLVIIRWLIQRGGSAERIAALQAEVSEARVQYEAVCVLLQKRTGYDDLDSEPEGDEREHLIVPPKPVVIEEGIKGISANHARTLLLLCALHRLLLLRSYAHSALIFPLCPIPTGHRQAKGGHGQGVSRRQVRQGPRQPHRFTHTQEELLISRVL